VVKGVNFLELRDAGDPVELARQYDAAGADELVFLDITASSDARTSVYEVIRDTADQVFIPLTVGGGVRQPGDVRLMLESGADKVSMNTAAVERPELIGEGAHGFGSQCIVVAIDARRRGDDPAADGALPFLAHLTANLPIQHLVDRAPPSIELVPWCGDLLLARGEIAERVIRVDELARATRLWFVNSVRGRVKARL